MDSEPLFATGSHTFEITGYNLVKDLDKGAGIQSERFTVGGYDWMIQFYPRGIQNVSCHQNAPSNVDYISVYVKLLSTSREVQAMYSFSMWDWNTKRWLKLFMNDHTSKLHTYTPFSTWGAATFMKKSDLDNRSYLFDDALKIMCTLFVKLPPPSPFGCGFHTDSYAPPNLPRQPTVSIYGEAAKDLSLTARKGVVALAPADSSDQYQVVN